MKMHVPSWNFVPQLLFLFYCTPKRLSGKQSVFFLNPTNSELLFRATLRFHCVGLILVDGRKCKYD